MGVLLGKKRSNVDYCEKNISAFKKEIELKNYRAKIGGPYPF